MYNTESMVIMQNGDAKRLEKDEDSNVYKVGRCYCTSKGIIDNFLGFDKEEAALNTVKCDWTGQTQINDIRMYFDSFEDMINRTIIVIENDEDKPHTIKYFPIPTFDDCSMDWCAVAKIENNGSTYVFSKNEAFVRGY